MKIPHFKKSILAGSLSLVILGSQSLELMAASETPETFEYEGTTQISSVEYYPVFDVSASALTVEEVYVTAGTFVQEGDAILKLTDDSYQSALEYYNAAILRAKNSLTQEELSYTQGMQSAEYELELALADEEQASFLQEQSEAELADTIGEHEEVLTEMEERIEALEDGEYDTEEASQSQVSGSGLSGSSLYGTGNAASERLSTDDEEATETISQTLPGETEPNDTDLETEQNPVTGEAKSGNVPETLQIENAEERSDLGLDQTEPEAAVREQIAVLEEEAESLSETLAKYQETETALEEEIKKEDREYNAILSEIYTLILEEEFDESVLSGAGIFLLEQEADLAENRVSKTGSAQEISEETYAEAEDIAEAETSQTEESATEEPQTEEPQTEGSQTEDSQTEDSQTEGSQTEETHTEGSQTEETQTEGSQTEGSQTEETQTDGSQTEETQAEETQTEEPQTEETQTGDAQTEGSQTEETQTDGSQAGGSQTEAPEETTDVEDLIRQLYEKEAVRQELYREYCDVIRDQEREQVKEKLSETQEEILALGQQVTELESQSGEDQRTVQEQEDSSLEVNNDTLQEQAEELQQAAAGGQLGEADAFDLSGQSGTTDVSSLFDLSALSDQSGRTDTSGLGSLSGLTLSGWTDAAQGEASMSVGGSQTLSGMQSLLNGQNSATMFGSTYDLTQAKALLERTATDEDEAEELLEELYSMQESVQFSYEELLRKQTPLQLEIDYQYDTTIRAARLAEITYEQTVTALEEELKESQEALSDLEEALWELESLGDGTVIAKTSGTLSAVNYEAGDTLMAVLPMYSIYDTDVATIWISVPQSEIAQIAVGDTVEVSLGGISTVEGTVTEKAMEAQEGNSRTTVNYEVEISLENSMGLQSAGTAATVTVTAK